MLDKKENLKIFLGYAIMSLQKLGYSENSIKNFIKEMENVIKFISDAEAADTIDKFLDDSTKQVIYPVSERFTKKKTKNTEKG